MGSLIVYKDVTWYMMENFVNEIKLLTYQKSVKDTQRRFSRFKYKLPVVIEFEETPEEQIEAHLFDISVTGLSFLSMHLFNPDQKLLVTVQSEFRHYQLHGIVKHSTSREEYYKTGIQFVLTK